MSRGSVRFANGRRAARGRRGSRASASGVMVHLFCDLPDSSPGDSVPLLHCKRVIRSFEFDVWPQANIPGMNCRFQVQGLRVSGNGVAEPSEISRLVDPLWILPEFTGALEIRVAERDPYTPCKRPVAVEGRNLDEAADEEMLAIYYALVGRELAPLLPIARRERQPSVRRIEMPCQRWAVKALTTTRALKGSLIHLPTV